MQKFILEYGSMFFNRLLNYKKVIIAKGEADIIENKIQKI